jgi:hypothetical protein
MPSYSRSVQKTLPLTVNNTGFLLDRLGQDCHPLQFLRELTQNSIEAIQRVPDQTGDIAWDVDWVSYDLAESPAFKLSITDTGDGMTGEQMVQLINQLSSSLAEQSMAGHYGVGAKIAAATRNHAGLLYLSWKSGRGSMIHLWRDPESEQYGLRQFRRPDGTFAHYSEVDDAVKPDLIKDHGTRIVLYGNSETADTMTAPEGAPSPSRWVAKYLNSRYFRIPEGVLIRAREGWEFERTDVDRNLLRKITGQAEYLKQHAEANGTVTLDSAIAHWWILKDEKALDSNSGYIESSGHIAALYQDELYELMTSRGGRARLQNFGILLGSKRVVVYVEPLPDGSRAITTNTARTHLLIDSDSLPWHEWEAEFRDKMPKQIVALMETVAAGAEETDHTKSIRDRLKQIMDLFKVSRYRLTPLGDVLVDPRSSRGGEPAHKESRTVGEGRTGGRGGTAGGVYSVFLKKDGVPGQDVKADPFPEPRWVSVSNGTREPRDIEDRAARYLMDQNVLLINADFRVFTDMIKRWLREFENPAPVEAIVRDTVHGWYEQALVETVIGVQALKDAPEWSVRDIEKALSEEALTAAVAQRYHVFNNIKRELGSKLGKLVPS